MSKKRQKKHASLRTKPYLILLLLIIVVGLLFKPVSSFLFPVVRADYIIPNLGNTIHCDVKYMDEVEKAGTALNDALKKMKKGEFGTKGVGPYLVTWNQIASKYCK